MDATPSYETVLEALQGLKARGYVYDFNLVQDGLSCTDLNLHLTPDHFRIAEHHRFEGESDPSENAVVYAVESDGGVMGTLINAYGVYADPMTDDLIARLSPERAAGQSRANG